MLFNIQAINNNTQETHLRPALLGSLLSRNRTGASPTKVRMTFAFGPLSRSLCEDHKDKIPLIFILIHLKTWWLMVLNDSVMFYILWWSHVHMALQ